MKQINSIMIILLLFISLQSQTIEKHKTIVAGLNNYMEFIHQTTHSEFIYFYRFRNFNSDLVEFTKNHKKIINYSNENIIENNTYFEQSPKEIYNLCLNSTFGTTTNEKKILDEHLKKMFLCIQKIQNYNDSIYKYVSTDEYKTDTNAKKGFLFLELISNEFDAYISEWKNLVSETNKIYSKYQYYSPKNPFLYTAKHLALFLI